MKNFNNNIVLARGKGLSKMMKVCFERKLTTQNSEVKVKNPDDLNSSWIIYERKRG